jgi:hypothetical protein
MGEKETIPLRYFVHVILVVCTPEVAAVPSHRVTCDGWSALMPPIRALRVTLRYMVGSANKILTRRYTSSQFQRRSCSVCNGNGGVVWVITLFMGRV